MKNDLDAGSMQSRPHHGSLIEACESDDLLSTLRELRRALAYAIEVGQVSVVAQNAARLQLVAEAIHAIVSENPEGSTTDDLRNRAAAGLSKAEVVQLAGRRSKRRSG